MFLKTGIFPFFRKKIPALGPTPNKTVMTPTSNQEVNTTQGSAQSDAKGQTQTLIYYVLFFIGWWSHILHVFMQMLCHRFGPLNKLHMCQKKTALQIWHDDGRVKHVTWSIYQNI